MYFIQNNTTIRKIDRKNGESEILLHTKYDENRKTGNVEAGIPYVDVIDDSLDTFVFVLKDYPQRKPFKPFDIIEFTVDDGLKEDVTKLFVLFDNVKSYARTRGTYQHTVSCVELTKILEKTKIFQLSLTNQRDTLLNQVYKALTNAEPIIATGKSGIDKRHNRFRFTDRLELFLSGKPGFDFHFTSTNLRAVLDEMLSVYNCRIFVKDISVSSNGIGAIDLDYIAMDTIADVEPKWEESEQGEIVFEELENDGHNFAGNVVAQGYNSVLEEPITFTDIFKSANATISDITAAIMLPFPISDKGIKELKICNCRGTYRNVSTGETVIHRFDLDVSAFFLPQEQYDLLDQETRKKYIPYNIKSNSINVGNTYSGFLGFQHSVFGNVLYNLMPKEIDMVPGVSTSPKYNLVGTTIDWLNLTFTCTYYPLIDTVAQISKPETYDKSELLMGIMDSQTEQTLNVERHGKKLTGLIKRTGNTEYVMDVKAKYFSKLLPIMSRIDLPNATDDEERNFVLYKREYSVFDNYINCRYHFSKDYNAVQANAGVNREKHLFDIPLESNETPLVVKKYLQFSLGKEEVEENIKDLSFKPTVAYAALGLLFAQNESEEYTVNDNKLMGKGKIKYLLFQSQGSDNAEIAEGLYPQNSENGTGDCPYTDEKYRFVIPTGNYALGKTMNFAARTLDNYSVSYSRDGYTFSLWGDGGNKIAYCRYVDKDERRVGECFKFYLDFTFDFIYDKQDTSENVDTFPITKADYFISAQEDKIVYTYDKDRTQKPLFVLSFECIPAKKDKNELIIGTAFCKNNNLVRDNGDGYAGVKLYCSTSKIFNGDEDHLPSDYSGEEMDKALFSIEKTEVGAKLVYKGGEMPLVKSWAFADANGNIYLAANGTYQDVYVRMIDLLR